MDSKSNQIGYQVAFKAAVDLTDPGDVDVAALMELSDDLWDELRTRLESFESGSGRKRSGTSKPKASNGRSRGTSNRKGGGGKPWREDRATRGQHDKIAELCEDLEIDVPDYDTKGEASDLIEDLIAAVEEQDQG